MKKTVQNLGCPLCATNIPFDAMELMKGTQFKCPNPECNATIGLAKESMEAMKKVN